MDNDSSDMCMVHFIPRWTSAYRLEVRNLGAVYNEYSLHTN
jgi:hypothetical protein